VPKGIAVFWSNLLWLNIRRFRKMWFWRVLLSGVDAVMILLCSQEGVVSLWWLWGLLFVGMHMVVVNLKSHLEARSTVVLLRSLGASYAFVVMNMLLEMVFPYLVGVVIALLGGGIMGILFREGVRILWLPWVLVVLSGLAFILVSTPLFALYSIHQQERYLKEI